MINTDEHETDRLFIRRFADKDIDAIYKMRSDPEFMRYLSKPETRQEVISWIKLVSSYWNFNIGFWAIVLKETNETIGWTGSWLLFEFPITEAEIGYAISKKYAGKGLATEGARFGLDYAFQVRKAEKVHAVAHPENVASHRIMEKLGMQRNEQKFFSSYNMKTVYYSISLEEYNQDQLKFI